MIVTLYLYVPNVLIISILMISEEVIILSCLCFFVNHIYQWIWRFHLQCNMDLVSFHGDT